jgi:ribA/ribD-fused uncharacterized protein
MDNKFTFFWPGPFSQWAHAEFIVDNIKYNCAEQFMMHQKALHFNDLAIADDIMHTSLPDAQKRLGRQVKGFVESEWNAVAKDLVYVGNYHKFTQNIKLMTQLMATEDTLLVEASPFDKIWGIGLDASAAAKTPQDKWPGKNLLGLVLTELRDNLNRNGYAI